MKFNDLFAHMQWADAQVWRAVMETPAAAVDERTKGLLTHVHNVQWAYLQVWRGEPLQFRQPDDFPGPAEVIAWACRYYEEVPATLRTFEERNPAETVHFPWAGMLVEKFGAVHDTTLHESALQIVMHSTYHRGQVNSRIRELGGEPPLVDYVAWIWMGRPAPAWPTPISG